MIFISNLTDIQNSFFLTVLLKQFLVRNIFVETVTAPPHPAK